MSQLRKELRMVLIMSIVILFVLVEGVYKWWIDGPNPDHVQQIIPELAIAPIVHEAHRTMPAAQGER